MGKSKNTIERCREKDCSKSVWVFNIDNHVAETHNGTREWCKPFALVKSKVTKIAKKELSKKITTRKRKSSTNSKGPKSKRQKIEVKVEPSSIEAAVAQTNPVSDTTIKTDPTDDIIELSSEQAKAVC